MRGGISEEQHLFRSLRVLLLLKTKLCRETSSLCAEERSRLQSQLRSELLSVVSNAADLFNAVHWMPPGFLWAGRFPDWTVGLLGSISSVIDQNMDPDPTVPASPSGSPFPPSDGYEEPDSFDPLEPPPLDWRSDSSVDGGYDDDLKDFVDGLDKTSPDPPEHGANRDPTQEDGTEKLKVLANFEGVYEDALNKASPGPSHESPLDPTEQNGVVADEDHSRIQSLLSQLQLRKEEEEESYPTASTPSRTAQCPARASSPEADETTGLLFSEDHQRDAVELLQASAVPPLSGDVDAVVSVSYNQDDTRKFWGRYDKAPAHTQRQDSLCSQPDDEEPEPVWMKLGEEPPDQDPETQEEAEPSYKDVPGPCDPEDLLDGVIFGAKYLGSTQIRSDRNPSTNARMSQAQEAVDRIKAPEGESQPMTEVDLFISTKRIKVLTADTQEAMMDHPLQMISYIADMEQVVVLMARRKRKGAETEEKKKCLMICHVFTSDDAQVIAQAIGQAFGVAYQQFLLVNGIKASDLKPGEYSHYLESQELYNGELAHFCDAQNIKEVAITKPPGEMLGLAVVESGWGSILPTVVVANMLHGGPAERCGELSIGDRIMSVNGTSLVGLPISTCHNIIKDLKSQKYVKLSLVHCPPVTMAIIRRPEPKYQLGFSVEDGIICSLMRGGIAERGGIRVGHRIIEINGQSVVATTHDKIIQTLSTAVGEIHLKTMPASTYRLLTGQEQPVYL
uniref:Amyloid-beta A4 precursor protein-binding family A member 3 n=1 Tax=Knipowitschia caucasica TaxID=637954 RepID=A0AAV2KSW9_KNICA